MRNTAVNADRLLAACRDIGDAVLDPARWPGIMAQIGGAAGAAGVVLLQSDARTPDAPRTESAHEAYSNYFSAGWHRRDTLAERGFPLFMAGRPVITEQDLVTPEEMKRHAFYNEVPAALPLQMVCRNRIYGWVRPVGHDHHTRAEAGAIRAI